MMRTGLIAQKLGMTQIFKDDGERVPVTVLSIGDLQVVGVRTKDVNGYNAVQLGSHIASNKHVSKALQGHFKKAGVPSYKHLKEFRVSEDALLDKGAKISASHFVEGQYVDVTSVSKGKGFAGGMKRWNFGGLEATHGISISHRALGSTGNCQDPGRTFKNKKMPGQLGAEQVTTLNIKVAAVDPDKGLVFIKGSVPGPRSSVVYIRDAIKKPGQKDLPYPAALVEAKA